jgi:hypothetical protein
MYFPADDSQLHILPAPEKINEQSGHERILVVEDRADVAELARMVLEEFSQGHCNR